LSSSEQNRRVSIGAPSLPCSCRKWKSTSRTALNIRTGTLMSPNDSEPDQIGRAISR
jgi:hypothetical protein